MSISLDRDAQTYLRERRARSVISSLTELEPEALRHEERSLRKRYGHGPVMEAEFEVTATDNVPRYFRLDPVANPSGVLVYFHGGGWVMGEPEDYLAVCRALAEASGWRVIVPEYRKAPEHPFPAAFDDAMAIFDQIHALMCTAARRLPLAVGGDSAGGHLAAGVAQEFSRRNPGVLAAQILVTPVLDVDFDTPSYQDPERQLTLTRDLMKWFWNQYAPTRAGNDPRLAPLQGSRFEQLPSTVFVSVKSDVLWSEGDQYLSKLIAAGVAVSSREFAGQLHGFFQLYNVIAASKDAVSWIAKELNKLVGNESHSRLETRRDE